MRDTVTRAKKEAEENKECQNCGGKMVRVFGLIEHPGPNYELIGHLGGFLFWECNDCGYRDNEY